MTKRFVIFLLICTLGLGLCACIKNAEDTLLLESRSPDGRYVLYAYRTEPGATVDFSVRVYLSCGDRKTLVYDAYHEREVEILWLDDDRVSINNKVLDLSLGETYDWRRSS